MQNELGSDMFPVKELTMNLYPDHSNHKKIQTTVSNILRKLQVNRFIHRDRKGNYWYVGLTRYGFERIKDELNKNQLKVLAKIYLR